MLTWGIGTMEKPISAVAALCVLATLVGLPARAEELTILWADWDPANYLQELVNQYTAETGVPVRVETTPWPDFQNKAFLEFNAHGDAYDLVVGDSQWIGAGATEGHYVELTDFVSAHRLTEIMTPASMTYYSEYPKGSGRYWSVPLETDAVGWAYRKDWFEAPVEMSAFKEKYGYDLAPPKTWKALRDIAEFFYRPKANPPRYGVAIYMQSNADGLAMGFTTALYSYGGDLGDYATCAVDGIVNGPRAVAALEAYKVLYALTPPGWSNAAFVENNLAITDSLAAMSMNYFAFFPSLINPAVNPHAADTGFFANPAGPTGDRYSALGGQGISIVAYSKKQEAAKQFLEWLVRDDTQQKWADFGGYTADATILQSEKFRSATPYNEAFFESMFVVKDFWAEPYYAELLQQMNQRLAPYMLGDTVTATEALDGLAADWRATIAKHGCK
jgi:multiple sugar transport system substrate-binding protein